MTRRTCSSPLWDRRRWLQQVGLGLGSLALGGLGGCGGGDETASSLSSGWSWPTGMTARWDHLPGTGLVQAQAVHSSSGAVSEASALLGNTACTLGAGARVVLDFGSVVGGVPALNIDAFSGTPELSLSFSESAEWIDGGDATLGFSIASEPERAVSWPVTAAGLWQGRVLQGGQRWMTVQVGGSGSVTLRQPGLQAVTIATPADLDSTGWFRCSDTLLEAIWMAGARTCELNRMAAGSQPRPWRLTDAGADIGPSGLALHQGGTGWTTGTLSFTLTVNRGGLGWVVRGSRLTRLSFTLCAADDTEHPDTLLIETGSIFIGGVRTLSRQTLPATLPTGRAVQVTTVVGDNLIDVSIDGQTVASVSVAEIGFLPAGSIGFFNRSDCAAVVTALRMSDSGGGTLFSSHLTAAEQASVEQAFPVGTNGLPLLTDGAKRERQVFSMDLVAAAPTLYCTSGAHAHVAGSLRLPCAYPAADGQLASSLDPALSLTPLAASAAPQMRWYSASYSAHTVIALAEHWRQSGDLALVRELWSAVSGEIAWLLAQVGSHGLVVTDSGNGLDWHPQFGGPVVGAAGLTNLIVVKALLDAAELAQAQGLTASATAWQAQAADLQAAMDSLLQDDATGLYEVSDSRRGLVAQDVNALAVLWDRVPQERALRILDRLEAALATDQGHRAFSGDSAWSGVISPMVSGFEVAALFRAGRGNAALQLIRAGWRMMIEHATHACGTTWESMTDQGVPSGPDVSLAHAWSSGPTAALSRHVLGLRPLQAGWTRWLCKPVLGDLSWAAGQVPTPQGALGVRWLRAPADGLALALRLQVPEGTSGVLALPLSLGRGAVRVNGSAVTLQDALDQDSDLDQASHRWLSLSTAGTHQIEVDAA